MITHVKHSIAFILLTLLCLASEVKASLTDLPDELLLRISYNPGVAKSLKPINYKLASLFSSHGSTLTIRLKDLNSSTFNNYLLGKRNDEKDLKSPLEKPSPQ